MIKRSARRARSAIVLTSSAVALVVSMATAVSPAGASPAKSAHTHRQLRHAFARTNAIHHGLPQALEQGLVPSSVPKQGRYAFLLRLNIASTLTRYQQNVRRGRPAAASAARSQFSRIKAQQADVIAALPSGSHVLYKTHAVLAGVAVMTDVGNYGTLRGIRGVQAVYPIAPKSISNSYAMPLQHGPQAWQAEGDLGANSTIAIIDTGVDYTHADLGGSGNPADYQTALAHDTEPVESSAYDHAKFDDATGADGQPVGFYDFVGDDYNADPNPIPPEQPFQPVPHPDSNPLDCTDHGSHVAGIAAGYGENPDGTTFTGNYLTLPTDPASYQPLFRIGPGMAPDAKVLSYKVFGCSGSTDVVGAAIDRAMDPNQDGNPSDHADVINMSLGADYASPQDGDSVEANLASKAGITVVTAAGNGGDHYDVGGSPGNAVRTIDVADTVDAYNQIDTLGVTINNIAHDVGAQRSVAYDWANKPDLSGDAVALTDPGNLDGCDPISQNIAGKVVFLEWTDNDATRRCGSAARSQNAENAGATGAILGEDEETFAAGITGSADIPVVQVVKSAADAIEAALNANQPVTVTGTSAADFGQLVNGDDDKVNTSSSRGVRGAGDVKPDVSAVGTSVFSTAMGTGNKGVSFTGTSMATPMVAGLAALVKSQHPDWTPEEVKADIMNTAGQDLYTGAGHTGRKYAPNRVGAGRIEADTAVSNQVLAFVNGTPGAVSVSFGPVATTGATTLTKTVNVVNTSSGPASFTVGYRPITGVPGVNYQVSPSSITVGAGSTKTLTVKLVVAHPAALTKTRDATVARNIDLGASSPIPREFLADASGRIELTPAKSYAGPALRVPVYSAPRPAATMTQPSAVTLAGSGVQTAAMKLSGHGLKQGSGAAVIRSYDAGLELQATSGQAPTCSAPTAERCVHFAAERSADLKYIGFTSDSPLVKSLGGRPIQDGQAYFAITTQKPWTTPVGPQEFDILIDTNGDNKPDAVLYNTRLGAEDIFLSELLDITDPNHPFIRDDELINDRLGSTDTALFDSDTMLLPLWPAALGRLTQAVNGINAPALPGFNGSHTRIHYGVVSFGQIGVVDSLGVNPATGALNSGRLSADVVHPGVEVVDAPDMLKNVPQTVGLVLNPDQPGKVLTVRRDVAAYNADHGRGMLILHLHNKAAAKAQVVSLKSRPTVTLRLSKTTVPLHHSLTATIGVVNTAGHRPLGRVALRRANGTLIKSGSLRNGRISFTWKPGKRGTFTVHATYGGDTHYVSGTSAAHIYKITLGPGRS